NATTQTIASTAATATDDVVSQILGIDTSSPIAALRADRPQQIAELQAYYDSLFAPDADSAAALPVADRALVAIRVASHTGSDAVVAWYEGVAREQGATDAQIAAAKDIATPNAAQTALGAAIRRADLVTTHLVDTTKDDVDALKAAGFTPQGILALSQVIAFVSYQARFVAGLRAFLRDTTEAPFTLPEAPAKGVRPALGSDATPEFTLDLLAWTPWLETAYETDLTPEQRAAVEAFVGTSPNAIYQATLANDLGSLKARAKVHHHLFTSEEPEPTAWRELGATTASRINGCVFCASVHARIYAHKSGKREVAEALLRDSIDAELPAVERAVVDLATRVTLAPESLSQADFTALRDLGFDDLGILDIINYTAFFANANRLMLTLGEPHPARHS
ncbi:MAG: peroxidase-related enzyme, partial [Thermomicrobiales bacterium]